MLDIYLNLLPIFLLIIAGIILKTIGIIKKEEASLVLRLVFYLTMPMLVLTNIPKTVISHDFLFLPLLPPIIGAILFFLSRFIGNRLGLERKTLGVFIISSLIINTAFLFPFVSAIFGQEGISRILILDAGNAVVIFSFAYYQACKYGNHGLTRWQIFKRILGAVPLWAVLIAVIMNITGVQLQGPLYQFAKMTGDLTIPLLLVSVGIFFEPRLVHFKLSFLALFIRMGLGMLLGLLLVYLFDLEGLTKYVAILGTATPVGYNALTFSSIENLDKEFAAGIVSTSILLALIYIPFIIFLLVK